MKFIERFLNILVLLGSFAIIAVLSVELLSGNAILSNHFILVFHLVVCAVFLTDFFVRLYFSTHKGHFLLHNIIFLLVSIPYLNIISAISPSMSHMAWLILRLIPLARGIYGVSIVISWMTRSRITNLFMTYLAILFMTVYFSSILFYFFEQGINPPVKTYWDAIIWALMNVTTVGSDIFGVTKVGQMLAVVLAASGMIFFPIFTAYVTTKFQNKRKELKAINEDKNK